MRSIKNVVSKRGARTACGWPRQGILSAAMGRRRAKSQVSPAAWRYRLRKDFSSAAIRRGAISTGRKALGEKYLNRAANWPGSEHPSI
jgi:hypothetical protein